MKLFIDTTNWKLCLILFKGAKIIDQTIILNNKKISDIVMDEIKKLLDRHNLSLNKIVDFYVTKGPGSYTGVRVGLTIVKTLKTIDDSRKVFLIDSLLFQAGNEQAISLLDARSQKWYCGVFDNCKQVGELKLIDENELIKLQQIYTNFKVLKDNEQTNFAKNLIQLLTAFIEVKTTQEIEPVYLKSFI